MKNFNSIKWRLQVWYGLILVAVLAGFGITAHKWESTALQLENARRLRQVDEELNLRIVFLAKELSPLPPSPPDSEFQDPDRPRGSLNELRPSSAQPPPERPQSLLSPDYLARLDDLLNSSKGRKLFGDENAIQFNFRNQFHIGIISPDGHQFLTRSLRRYKEYPWELSWMMLEFAGKLMPNGQTNFFPKPDDLGIPRTIENSRKLSKMLPSGECIEVSRSLDDELLEQKSNAAKLVGLGGIILCLGLAGGWWTVSRAMRPVSEISAAATNISAGDLSQRINTAETDSELGQLAAVLNSTFARLDAAFAQQRQFAADAAHELRTPVSVMLTQAQTALSRERCSAEYRESLEACQRAAQRMRRLIESLLELARLDAGQEVLKRLRFDFSKTISDCTESVKPFAHERGVMIVSALPPVEITGDADRLAQVITNLLTNAIQYNRDGGQVSVKLESQTGLAVLTVHDTGPGIAAEDLPHVFERFYRGDKSRTGSGSTGLGLAIAKAIVEAHGGTIEAASKKGYGTTFTVRLPV
jgi:two-component system OmpR family sensor kinase